MRALLCFFVVLFFSMHGFAADISRGEQLWQELEQVQSLPIGTVNAGQKIYIFMDPNCPYCKNIAGDIIGFIGGGQKIDARIIPVGILGPDSADKVRSIYQDANPATAWLGYLQTGQLPRVTTRKTTDMQEKHFALFRRWNFDLVPFFVWRGGDNKVYVMRGTPNKPVEFWQALGIETVKP
jgi:thiol:disulfide interchange protein DsbG